MNTPVLTSKASPPLKSPSSLGWNPGFLCLPLCHADPGARHSWVWLVTATSPGLLKSVLSFCRMLSTSGRSQLRNSSSVALRSCVQVT